MKSLKIQKKNRAFTLIELLVVVAIIGVLSTVVTTSVSTARNKTKTIAIKANMDTIRKQAQIWYDTYGTYFLPPASTTVSSCFGLNIDTTMLIDPVINQSLIQIDSLNGSTNPVSCQVQRYGNGTLVYAIGSYLPTGGNACIDQTGIMKSNFMQSVDGNGNVSMWCF